MQSFPRDPAKEEFLNLLTHGSGLLLALVGAFVVFSSVTALSSGVMQFGCCIYAGALIGVYAASTLSHSFENPDRRRFFRSLDQGVIFLFIAATFTPIAIAYLTPPINWIVPALMWTLALAGFTSKVFWRHRVESISILHYLALGCLPVAVIVPIMRSLPIGGAACFLAGAACYTIGTVFLALDQRVRYFHAVWHVLVIAGSACHFCLVVGYAMPLM